jgi:hypothetical protein
MWVDYKHFAEPITFAARSDRMVVREESRAGTLNRDLSITTLVVK